MGFVGNYAPCGLSPQTDGMPVIRKKDPCMSAAAPLPSVSLYSREQRAKRACSHVHLATAARVFYLFSLSLITSVKEEASPAIPCISEGIMIFVDLPSAAF